MNGDSFALKSIAAHVATLNDARGAWQQRTHVVSTLDFKARGTKITAKRCKLITD